jgi:hypothetical protein
MIFTIKILIEDQSLSDGEDIQMVLEDLFEEHLPSDLTAQVVDVVEGTDDIE